jgi:hypothetical protein
LAYLIQPKLAELEGSGNRPNDLKKRDEMPILGLGHAYNPRWIPEISNLITGTCRQPPTVGAEFGGSSRAAKAQQAVFF